MPSMTQSRWISRPSRTISSCCGWDQALPVPVSRETSPTSTVVDGTTAPPAGTTTRSPLLIGRHLECEWPLDLQARHEHLLLERLATRRSVGRLRLLLRLVA